MPPFRLPPTQVGDSSSVLDRQGLPVFKTAIKQTTFLDTSLRRSQWEPLPQIGEAADASSVAGGTRAARAEQRKVAGRAIDAETRESKKDHRRQQRLPDITPWRPGDYAAGRRFGPPPFLGVSDRALAYRIGTLRHGIESATSEAAAYEGSVLQHFQEFRGAILAGRDELERELAVALEEQKSRAERPRRRRLRTIPVVDSAGDVYRGLQESISAPALIM